LGFVVWVVFYGDFFAVAFVDVYVGAKSWSKSLCVVAAMTALPVLWLIAEVVGDDFGCVTIECAGEFVHYQNWAGVWLVVRFGSGVFVHR